MEPVKQILVIFIALAFISFPLLFSKPGVIAIMVTSSSLAMTFHLLFKKHELKSNKKRHKNLNHKSMLNNETAHN